MAFLSGLRARFTRSAAPGGASGGFEGGRRGSLPCATGSSARDVTVVSAGGPSRASKVGSVVRKIINFFGKDLVARPEGSRFGVGCGKAGIFGFHKTIHAWFAAKRAVIRPLAAKDTIRFILQERAEQEFDHGKMLEVTSELDRQTMDRDAYIKERTAELLAYRDSSDLGLTVDEKDEVLKIDQNSLSIAKFHGPTSKYTHQLRCLNVAEAVVHVANAVILTPVRMATAVGQLGLATAAVGTAVGVAGAGVAVVGSLALGGAAVVGSLAVGAAAIAGGVGAGLTAANGVRRLAGGEKNADTPLARIVPEKLGGANREERRALVAARAEAE